ncbi:MAG TPA: hypothetical protein VI461_08115, partial [Chitinophagaceae bacterium]|nr:hypothetical protein [Chitinophagaceae bacterium]
MKRFLVPVSLCILLLQTLLTGAQYYFYNDKYYNSNWVLEIGGSVGFMNSLTDIGGKKGIGKKFIKDLNFNLSKPSFSIYAITMYKDVLGIRIEGTIGKAEAYDSILKTVAASTFGRYERNLSFRSDITDFQLSAEVHPLFFKSYDEGEAPRISPYAVAGIGFFTFNPEANLNGQWYALQPLHTEGQGFAEYPGRKPYQLKQVNIPLGIGVKYEVNSFLNARLEIVYRKLFTDYLDDVSNLDYIDPALFNTYLSHTQAALAQQLY